MSGRCKVCRKKIASGKVVCNSECNKTLFGRQAKERRGSRSNLFKHGGGSKNQLAPEYVAWLAMKQRCYYKAGEAYQRYGARGIRVAAEWLSDFPQFLRDVGKRPSPKHTLDRYPDGDGDYEPGNVRWATRRQQAMNRKPKTLSLYCRKGHPLFGENMRWAGGYGVAKSAREANGQVYKNRQKIVKMICPANALGSPW